MSEIKAVFFDQDGVIIDTEKDGHRVAFNETFKEFGYDFAWDVDEYHELLQISGGKEADLHALLRLYARDLRANNWTQQQRYHHP